MRAPSRALCRVHSRSIQGGVQDWTSPCPPPQGHGSFQFSPMGAHQQGQEWGELIVSRGTLKQCQTHISPTPHLVNSEPDRPHPLGTEPKPGHPTEQSLWISRTYGEVS